MSIDYYVCGGVCMVVVVGVGVGYVAYNRAVIGQRWSIEDRQ
jgi:hypothetical protein